MPKKTQDQPPPRDVHLHVADLDPQIQTDLKAVAHLKRTTPEAIVAEIVQKALGPTMASHVQAA